MENEPMIKGEMNREDGGLSKMHYIFLRET